MALLYVEGFDKVSASTGTASQSDAQKYIAYNYPYLNWSGVNNPQVFDEGRVNGQAFSFGNDGFADSNWIDFAWDNSTEDTVIVGFAYKPPFYEGNQTSDLVSFWDTRATSATEHIVIRQEHGCTLLVDRGASQIGTAIHKLQQGRWHYIEIKVTVNNTTGVVEIRVNGNTVLNLTNIDTQNGGNALINLVRFRGSDGAGSGYDTQALFDDIYICDDTGSANNDFLGVTRVETLLPNGVGDSNQFTPSAGANWENVDDATGDDGDTTYNESSTTAHLDLFGTGDLQDITSTVYGAQLCVLARVTDTNPKTIIPTIKSSTTEGAGTGVGVADNVDYIGVQHLFEQDPNAASAWTTATINSMQIGYEVG